CVCPPKPLCLSVLSTRQPPSSTLFPYTTLFRSELENLCGRQVLVRQQGRRRRGWLWAAACRHQQHGQAAKHQESGSTVSHRTSSGRLEPGSEPGWSVLAGRPDIYLLAGVPLALRSPARAPATYRVPPRHHASGLRRGRRHHPGVNTTNTVTTSSLPANITNASSRCPAGWTSA